jgi:hypothetical protein
VQEIWKHKDIEGDRERLEVEGVGRKSCMRNLARLNDTGNFTLVEAILSPVHLVRPQERQLPAGVSH